MQVSQLLPLILLQKYATQEKLMSAIGPMANRGESSHQIFKLGHFLCLIKEINVRYALFRSLKDMVESRYASYDVIR